MMRVWWLLCVCFFEEGRGRVVRVVRVARVGGGPKNALCRWGRRRNARPPCSRHPGGAHNRPHPPTRASTALERGVTTHAGRHPCRKTRAVAFRELQETHPTDPSVRAFHPPAFSASNRDVALYVFLKNLTMELPDMVFSCFAFFLSRRRPDRAIGCARRNKNPSAAAASLRHAAGVEAQEGVRVRSSPLGCQTALSRVLRARGGFSLFVARVHAPRRWGSQRKKKEKNALVVRRVLFLARAQRRQTTAFAARALPAAKRTTCSTHLPAAQDQGNLR
jgi:hypothetical protein